MCSTSPNASSGGFETHSKVENLNADTVDGKDSADLAGQTGPQGPAGPAGPAGADGATGPAGPAGSLDTSSVYRVSEAFPGNTSQVAGGIVHCANEGDIALGGGFILLGPHDYSWLSRPLGPDNTGKGTWEIAWQTISGAPGVGGASGYVVCAKASS